MCVGLLCCFTSTILLFTSFNNSFQTTTTAYRHSHSRCTFKLYFAFSIYFSFLFFFFLDCFFLAPGAFIAAPRLRFRPGRTPITPRRIIIAITTYNFCIFVKPSRSNSTDKKEKRLNFRLFFGASGVAIVFSLSNSSNSPEEDTIKMKILHNTKKRS